MKDLRPRLVSSILLIGLVGGTLFVFPLWMFALVIIGFSTAALHEFFTMVRHRGMLVNRALSVGLGLLLMTLVAWRSLVQPGHMTAPVTGEGATMLTWGWDIFWPATIVIIFLRQLLRQNTFEALSGLATTLFGLAYIGGLFSYFFYIRTFHAEQGAWLVLFLILVTKAGDMGAYVIGQIFGRHTLMPRISPRKTVEGFIGAMLVAGVVASAANAMVPRLHHSPYSGFALGLFLGICGQLGDLAESLLKRDCQVKDSGTLLPGIGGVLDVMDSLLFTAPIFYGYLIYG